MANPLRPSSCLAAIFREVGWQQTARRSYHAGESPIRKARQLLPPHLDQQFWSQLPPRLRPDAQNSNVIKILPPKAPIKKTCPDPVAAIQADQMALLDPSGVRTKMFDYRNREGAKVGDILHVTFKSGEPFSGVILSIKSRRQDTSVLLRNHLTRVGAEMALKVYSPNIASMEIVQRTPKRKRRARLYYMRKPKHDPGPIIQGVVDRYMRQKAALTGGKMTGRTPQGKGKRNTKRSDR